jgi:large subunit ribosomal protein L33
MRQRIVLACNECKNKNYNKYKSKTNTPERLEFKKYCKFCKAHTLHKEIK